MRLSNPFANRVDSNSIPNCTSYTPLTHFQRTHLPLSTLPVFFKVHRTIQGHPYNFTSCTMASESIPLSTDTHEQPSKRSAETPLPEPTPITMQTGHATFLRPNIIQRDTVPTSTTTGSMTFTESMFGLQATTAELQLQLVPTFVYSMLLLYRAVHLALLKSSIHYILFFTLAFDVTGGVLTTATLAGKAAYHRTSSRSISQDHVVFSVAHIFHVLIVAVMFRDGVDISFFLQVSTLLLISAAVVMSVPDYVKNVTAFVAVLNAVFLDLYVWGPTKCLEWFVPLLFIKVCVGFHVPSVTMDVHPAAIEVATV